MDIMSIAPRLKLYLIPKQQIQQNGNTANIRREINNCWPSASSCIYKCMVLVILAHVHKSSVQPLDGSRRERQEREGKGERREREKEKRWGYTFVLTQ